MFKCSRCAQSFSKRGQLAAFWPKECVPLSEFAQACGARLVADDPQGRLPPQPLVIADIQERRTPADHPLFPRVNLAHTLQVFRGVIYCTSCGAFGVEQARRLELVCQEPSAKGREALSRLSRGLPPKWGMAFPVLG